MIKLLNKQIYEHFHCILVKRECSRFYLHQIFHLSQMKEDLKRLCEHFLQKIKGIVSGRAEIQLRTPTTNTRNLLIYAEKRKPFLSSMRCCFKKKAKTITVWITMFVCTVR